MRISHAILPVPSQLQMDSLIPILNKNFRGNLRGSSVPMDNTVAISKNGFIVSAINTNVIFTQPDGEITYTKALSDFFFYSIWAQECTTQGLSMIRGKQIYIYVFARF